jgi:hypothetical protein
MSKVIFIKVVHLKEHSYIGYSYIGYSYKDSIDMLMVLMGCDIFPIFLYDHGFICMNYIYN